MESTLPWSSVPKCGPHSATWGTVRNDRCHLQVLIQELGWVWEAVTLFRQTWLWRSRSWAEFRWKEEALWTLPSAVSSLTTKDCEYSEY